MKNIKCKCTHNKLDHNRTRLGRWDDCNLCHCDQYMRHTKPDLFDKVFFGFGASVVTVSNSSDG